MGGSALLWEPVLRTLRAGMRRLLALFFPMKLLSIRRESCLRWMFRIRAFAKFHRPVQYQFMQEAGLKDSTMDRRQRPNLAKRPQASLLTRKETSMYVITITGAFEASAILAK